MPFFNTSTNVIFGLPNFFRSLHLDQFTLSYQCKKSIFKAKIDLSFSSNVWAFLSLQVHHVTMDGIPNIYIPMPAKSSLPTS